MKLKYLLKCIQKKIQKIQKEPPKDTTNRQNRKL